MTCINNPFSGNYKLKSYLLKGIPMKKDDEHRTRSSVRILLILILFAAFLTSGLVMVDSSFNSLTKSSTQIVNNEIDRTKDNENISKKITRSGGNSLEEAARETGHAILNWGSEIGGTCIDIIYDIKNKIFK